jgi:hypothetical protein
VAEDDRVRDSESRTERGNVVGAPFQAPIAEIRSLGATEAAKVEIYDLGDIRETRKMRLEVRVVIRAWTAVHEDDGWSLAHGRTFRDEAGTVNIEP